MLAIKRFAWLLLFALTATFGWAQTLLPPVNEPPPSITFPAIRESRLDDVSRVFSVRFPSPVTTDVVENNTVGVRCYVPAQATGPVPVVLILHYWGAKDLRIEEGIAIQLNELGIGAALISLPYHLERRPPNTVSGALAVRPDPAALREMMTQSVLDIRRTVDFLLSRPEFDGTKIGISGISLGSIVASLTFAVDSRIRSACFTLGGIDLAKLIWTSSRITTERDILRRKGYTEAKLREELASVEPGLYLPQRKTGAVFVIQARYDTVVPPVCSQELIDALPNPQVLLIDTGHYGGALVQRRLTREMVTFFSREFSGQLYSAPRGILTPTIRIGAGVFSPKGFDAAVGLDLIRSRHGSPFLSLLITPREPRLYLGLPLTTNLSIGAYLSAARVGLGLLWSIVL